MAPLMDRAKLPQDAVREFRRCTQGNAMLDYELGEYKRLFGEDENMEKSYKVLMLSLFSLGPELPQTENGNPSEERKQNLASGLGKDIPNDSKADEQRNVVSKKTERGVLRKRASSEFRNVVMEEIPEEDERVVSRKRSTRGSRKAIIEESKESDDSRIAIIEMPSSSDEVRDESDADTDGYDFFDDDYHEREDSYDFFDDDHHGREHSDMDMMKPRRSSKSRDVGESSRVAPTDCEVEYRRQVLEVMSKPYDMTEYTTINKKFDAQFYAKLFPELGDELEKCRHRRRKHLALMRGFYFWIRMLFFDMQDVAREGAFQPWRDEECLAVEPALPVRSPDRAKAKLVGESSRVAPARSEVEFRRRVLEIISEPYDKMEYMITMIEFDSKQQNITDDHPELGNELMKWRDNRRKQLALMRGFYFWMQNLTHEGAFKPWRDNVCLAVEAQPLSRGQ